MSRFSATARISLGLVCLTLSVVLAAKTLGLFPNRHAALIEGRNALCESMAIHCSWLASHNNTKQIEESLKLIVQRNPDILSAAVRRNDGELLAEVGDHAIKWHFDAARVSTDAHVFVPIAAENRPWGTVEVRFRTEEASGFLGLIRSKFVRLMTFIGVMSCLVHFFYLRKMLQHMDPSKVIPGRVRTALDTLAEGLLVLDDEERIVLANQSFAKIMGQSSEQLQGSRVSELPWTRDESANEEDLPWTQVIRDGQPLTGDVLGIEPNPSDQRKFLVNSSPILGDDGTNRGVLASFDDVTVLENKKVELGEMLQTLSKSREEIRRQNRELRLLATQDSLTGCLNRRAFFEGFESHWAASNASQGAISCVIVDIDYFKSVNDEFGHTAGDLALQKVAATLKSTARKHDLVCRYGGEEFCILLPQLNVEQAAETAEQCRRAIEDIEFPHRSLTASFGVSAISLGASSPQEMIDQADKCLYVAKRRGRNCVVRWDEVPDDGEMDSRDESVGEFDEAIAIPFHGVTALISALSYRDTSTAEHSRRVADLCVATAEGVMSVRECYVLEIGALLHDIGKIGVPDSVLLKPGPLTDVEWKLMGLHDRIGVEILRSTFASKELSQIVETHHARFDGNARDPELPSGEAIPLGARILTIADAYDAMVSDRVYRKGRSRQEAFDELRRCAGTQFDPNLVERFIAAVLARDEARSDDLPTVSKQTALRIGLQIEQLACAVDNQDIESLKALANRLKATSTKCGVPQIADVAGELEQAANVDPELAQILELTNDLLDLCRSTQGAYLDHACTSD